MSSLYDNFKTRGTRNPPEKGSGNYSFHGSAPTQEAPSRFRTRSPSQGSTTYRRSPPATTNYRRGQDKEDRPFAYYPPSDAPEQWAPPELRDILFDLLMRVIEVIIGAVAQEVALFFRYRRFNPAPPRSY